MQLVHILEKNIILSEISKEIIINASFIRHQATIFHHLLELKQIVGFTLHKDQVLFNGLQFHFEFLFHGGNFAIIHR